MLLRQSVGAEDVYLGMSGKSPASSDCDEMVVRIKLPGTVLRDIDLDVREQKILVSTPVLYVVFAACTSHDLRACVAASLPLLGERCVCGVRAACLRAFHIAHTRTYASPLPFALLHLLAASSILPCHTVYATKTAAPSGMHHSTHSQFGCALFALTPSDSLVPTLALFPNRPRVSKPMHARVVICM